MSELLNKVLDAYGGVDRWRALTTITARGRVGGLLPQRFPGNKLSNFTVEVSPAEQRTVLHDFPQPGRLGVFDRGQARIETADGEVIDVRTNPRTAFFGLSGLRRNVRWDRSDTTYFAGYAFWNYLTSPLLLTYPGIIVTEGRPCQIAGRRWRELQATFPGTIHTHCRQQTFYVDETASSAATTFAPNQSVPGPTPRSCAASTAPSMDWCFRPSGACSHAGRDTASCRCRPYWHSPSTR